MDAARIANDFGIDQWLVHRREQTAEVVPPAKPPGFAGNDLYADERKSSGVGRPITDVICCIRRFSTFMRRVVLPTPVGPSTSTSEPGAAPSIASMSSSRAATSRGCAIVKVPEMIQAFDQVGRYGGDAVQAHQSSPYVMKQTGASAAARMFVGGTDSRRETGGLNRQGSRLNINRPRLKVAQALNRVSLLPAQRTRETQRASSL